MSSSTLDLLAIVDVETTGLNPATDEVIELGCILYSLSHNTVLQQVSTLVPVGVDVNPVEHPVTELQSAEIIRLRAHVFSPKLPNFEPVRQSDG